MSMVKFLVLGLFLLLPLSIQAQDAAPQNADDFLRQQGAAEAAPVTDTAKAPALQEDKAEQEKPAESPDMIAKKLELARKMHQIRPTRLQVDSAINQAAMGMPEAERQPFVAAMHSVLNYNAIEKISIDAMVETFTLPELEAMVAYHSTPEAKSIGEKMAQWAMKVQPEVVRMIDSALMRVKTGGAGAASTPQ